MDPKILAGLGLLVVVVIIIAVVMSKGSEGDECKGKDTNAKYKLNAAE